MPAPEHSYYIDRYSDEIMPCEPSLEGWAAWLSKPDRDLDRDGPVLDGEAFQATVIEWQPDIIATRQGDVWVFSRDPAEADFLAIRFGEGLGWNADSIAGDAAGLIEWLTESGLDEVTGPEFIAVGLNRPPVTLTFRAGPPASLDVEVLQ